MDGDKTPQEQVDEVVKAAGEYKMPDIPPFLRRKKKVERVKRVEKENGG